MLGYQIWDEPIPMDELDQRMNKIVTGARRYTLRIVVEGRNYFER